MGVSLGASLKSIRNAGTAVFLRGVHVRLGVAFCHTGRGVCGGVAEIFGGAGVSSVGLAPERDARLGYLAVCGVFGGAGARTIVEVTWLSLPNVAAASGGATV